MEHGKHPLLGGQKPCWFHQPLPGRKMGQQKGTMLTSDRRVRPRK